MTEINLPPLGPHDHPEPWAFKWDETEIRAIQAYARQAIEADRAQRGVPGGGLLVPVLRYTDGFLCQAWGETDLPSVEIVQDHEGIARFMVREWLGSADHTDDDGTVTLDSVMQEIKDHDFKGEGAWKVEFEIGGVSVDQVNGIEYVRSDLAASTEQPTAQAAPPSPTPYEAARELGKWLNERPGHPIDLGLVAALVHHVQSDAQAAPEPYGQVAIIRRPGCGDQYWFYRWPQPPYLDSASECIMVYASLPPGESQQERKPMTDADIFNMPRAEYDARDRPDLYSFHEGFRAAERHHGISASNGKGERDE